MTPDFEILEMARAVRESGFFARLGSGGEGIFGRLSVERQPTLMFNGYADHVANMYSSMDLTRNF